VAQALPRSARRGRHLRSLRPPEPAIGGFFSPLASALATAGVVWILYQREFHSGVLEALQERPGGA